MKKLLAISAVLLFILSTVLAAGPGQDSAMPSDKMMEKPAGMPDINGTVPGPERAELENRTMNPERIRIRENGSMMRRPDNLTLGSGRRPDNMTGPRFEIRSENGLRLRVGAVEANSSLELTAGDGEGRLRARLSNGKNAEIKVMPDTASARAIERLQLKNCNADNGCSIQLKEVGNGNQTRAAYEVKAEKEAKVLGLFKTRMHVRAEVDAETGEVMKTNKPWWAFIASE